MQTPDDLMRYYLQELDYLREAGGAYAERYPKIAARLQLEAGESPDPHVERLIESVAFLTARIRQNFDNALPEVSGELLDVLYPHYQQPIPPMAIAQFRPDREKGGLTGANHIPRGTRLFSHATGELVCHFRTGYDVTLWPIEVESLAEQPPPEWEGLAEPADAVSMLFLRLRSWGPSFTELCQGDDPLRRLRFFINGSDATATQLWRLLLAQTVDVQIRGAGGQLGLGSDVFKPVGFSQAESLLPGMPEAHPAYRLLQEYFAFPRRFRFVDLDLELDQGLGVLAPEIVSAGQVLDVAIFFNRRADRKSWLSLKPELFSLGATPVINLFPRTTEPLRFDRTRSEYRLVPDRRRERYTEIQSVESISASADATERHREIRRYYSFHHDLGSQADGERAFWHTRRVPTQLKDAVGSDILLSFHDLDWDPGRPAEDVLYAHTLCNNRNLAEQLGDKSVLQSDQTDVLAVTLGAATQHAQPALGGEARWRLVSHLSLNYLSLTEGDKSLRLLKEMLELYNPHGRSSTLRQIRNLESLSTRSVLRRMKSEETWRGFVRGTEIDIVLDDQTETPGTGGNLLFAMVLDRFFALFAPADSFTQVVVREKSEQKKEWVRWPPRIGERVLP